MDASNGIIGSAGPDFEAALRRAMEFSLQEGQQVGGEDNDMVDAWPMQPSGADSHTPRQPVSGDEWLNVYFATLQMWPQTANQLFLFAKRHGGEMTYASARTAFNLLQETRQSELPARVQQTTEVRRPIAPPFPRIQQDGSSEWYTERGCFLDGETCAICLDSGGSCVQMRCNGGHCFHRDCIDDWLTRIYQPRCPTCRETLGVATDYQSQPARRTTDASALDGYHLHLPTAMA